MDFWDVFWLLLIFIPLLLIWGFAIVDIFRRDDLSGWLKALWIVIVVLLPFLGTLIYLIFRQPGATAQERRAMDQASREFVEKYAPNDSAQQLKLLADLHDRGKLTDAEFAEEKARVLDTAGAGSAPPGSPSGSPTTPAAGQAARDTGSTASWTRPPDGQGMSPGGPTSGPAGGSTGPAPPPAGPGEPPGPATPPASTGGSEPPRRPRGYGA
ncbi:SHOCT domain-containing protein [Catellatospora sichuanensis]|uniref:SHOCT domain-containing protein n=1 Tax=Catellatospora sichuanensis TaxID=1969805 RepID=UPI001182C963|nr:SHOCT domain-containing protein [Catellatospora sichuanensis]